MNIKVEDSKWNNKNFYIFKLKSIKLLIWIKNLQLYKLKFKVKLSH